LSIVFSVFFHFTAISGIIGNYSRIPTADLSPKADILCIKLDFSRTSCHEGVSRAVNFILFVLFSCIPAARLSPNTDNFGIIDNYSRIPSAGLSPNTAISAIISNYSRIPAM